MSYSPWMSDDVRMMQDSVRRLLEKEFLQHRERWDNEGIVDRPAWLKAGEAGILCPSIPEAYGGGGGTKAHDAMLAQEVERVGLGGGFGVGIGTHAMIAHYVLAYGSEEQRQRWLPAMSRGDFIGAVAMSEPGTGSDLRAIRTKAVKVDGGYRVSGQKIFISNGQNADLIVTVCRTGEHDTRGFLCWSSRRRAKASGVAVTSKSSASTRRTRRSCSSTRCSCLMPTFSAPRKDWASAS